MISYGASCAGQIAAGARYCPHCLDCYYPEDNPAALRCPVDSAPLAWVGAVDRWCCLECDHSATAATVGRAPAEWLPDGRFAD